MRLPSLLSRLLSALVIVAIALVLVATPAMAITKADTSAAMSSMNDDMDCCPKQHQSVPDCAVPCALAALCAVKCFPNAPALADGGAITSGKSAQLKPHDDLLRDRLGEPPPPRPPQA